MPGHSLADDLCDVVLAEIDGDDRGPRSLERCGVVAGPGPEVEDPGAVERQLHQRERAIGELVVERFGVALLGQEQLEQLGLAGDLWRHQLER